MKNTQTGLLILALLLPNAVLASAQAHEHDEGHAHEHAHGSHDHDGHGHDAHSHDAHSHGDHAHDGHAHSPQGHGEAVQTPWGRPGERANVDRKVEVSMDDKMRFSPQHLRVEAGETIHFVLRNDGQLLHEFVLGDAAELKEHAAQMASNPQMAHHEPYMVHVDPGKSGELIWTFNRAGSFEFACLIAGHFQAGMSGAVEVVRP